MSGSKPLEARDVHFAEILRRELDAGKHLNIEDLNDVRLTVTADLGRTSILVREVLELRRGSVIALDRLAGEATDIQVNGIPFAKGEVVVIADALHVRVSELLGASTKEEGEDEA